MNKFHIALLLIAALLLVSVNGQRSRRRQECYLPKVVGRCRAAFRRYYYNPSVRRCEQFIYGGCRGNRNNFRSYSACAARCMRRGRNSYD